MWINLTDEPVEVMLEDGTKKTIPPSGTVARLEMDWQQYNKGKDGITKYYCSNPGVHGVPITWSKDDKFIVSPEVMFFIDQQVSMDIWDGKIPPVYAQIKGTPGL